MLKASEVQILLMGATLAPLLWWMLHHAETWPERTLARASLVAILSSYVATVLEGFAFEYLLGLPRGLAARLCEVLGSGGGDSGGVT